MIKAEMYQQHSDEGLLEIEFEEYEDCFFADVPQVTQFLDAEVKRMQGELARAQTDSEKLISQLNSFLNQNHQIV